MNALVQQIMEDGSLRCKIVFVHECLRGHKSSSHVRTGRTLKGEAFLIGDTMTIEHKQNLLRADFTLVDHELVLIEQDPNKPSVFAKAVQHGSDHYEISWLFTRGIISCPRCSGSGKYRYGIDFRGRPCEGECFRCGGCGKVEELTPTGLGVLKNGRAYVGGADALRTLLK